MKRILGALILTLIASSAYAQVPATSTMSLQWDQADVDAPLLTFVVNTSVSPPTVVTDLTCESISATEFQCSTPISSLGLPQGTQVLSVVARRTIDGVNFDSEPSVGFTIVRGDIPGTPFNLTIIITAAP